MKIYLDCLSRVPTGSIGTQALIIASMQIISRYLPQAKFVMLSSCPRMDSSFFCNEGFDVTILKRSGSQIGTIKDTISIVKDVDAVVSAWGDGYISTPPYKILHKMSFLKSKNKPTVLFPSSIGPFSGGLKTFLARKGLERFDKLMVRDTLTLEYFNQIGMKDVSLVPDTAFVLEPSAEETINEIFKKECVPFDQRYIGLNISQLLNCFYKENNENYPKQMAEIADFLYESFNLAVLLIPHQVYPSRYEYVSPELLTSHNGDDRIAIKEVLNFVRNKSKIYPILGEYTARESKGIIKRCQIFIGGRMHTIIGATSLNIPSVLIQYSHKARGVMDTIGLSEYVWDYRSPKEEFIDKINTVWKQQDNLRKDIQSRMAGIKDEAWEAGKILFSLFK